MFARRPHAGRRAALTRRSSAAAAAAWTPASLTGLVDEWDAAATYCTTDAGADLEAGSSHYFSNAGNAALRGGSTWYRCGWIKLESVGVAHTLMSTLSGNDGYEVRVTTGNVLEVEVGTGSTTSTATHATSLSAATWYFWEAQYDGSDVGIALNGGSFTTTTTAFSAGSAAFRIGSTIAGGSYLDGVAQLFAVIGGNPSAGERTALYASGSPSTYAGITVPSNLTSWWNLHEASGARVDSHGSNDLTAVNTPGVAAGVASGTVQDRAPVKTWTGRRNSIALTQATIGDQPIWIASGQNGLPTLRGDGANHYIQGAFGSSYSQPNTLIISATFPTSTNMNIVDGDDGTNRHVFWRNGTTLSLFAGTTAGFTASPASDAAFIASAVFNGGSSVARLNGVDRSPAGTVGTAAWDGMTLFGASGGGSNADCDISRVIATSATASTSDLESAESYLNDLYAVY